MAGSINLCIGLNESNFITNSGQNLFFGVFCKAEVGLEPYFGQRCTRDPLYINEVKVHVPRSRSSEVKIDGKCKICIFFE